MGSRPTIKANVEINVYRAMDKRLIERIKVHNRFLDAGWRQLRDLVLYRAVPAGGLTTPDYIAVGTSAAATTDNMLALTAEVFRKAVSRRFAVDNSIWKYTMRIEASEANGSGTQILREFALVNTALGGDIWARAVTPPITKNSSLAVTVDWTFTGETV